MESLNIFVESPAASSIAPQKKMRKPKRKNKYEKRRAKARQAKANANVKENVKGNVKEKETQLIEKRIDQGGTGVDNGIDDNNEICSGNVNDNKRNDTNGSSDQSDDQKACESGNKEVIKNIDVDATTTTTTVSNTKSSSSSSSSSSSNSGVRESPSAIGKVSENVISSDQNEQTDKKKSTNEQMTARSAPTNTNTNYTDNYDNSRRNQQLRTEQALKDEVKRAEYMSTYHARPYEMDRKSGATWKIQESKASDHIFGDDDDDMDMDHNSDNDNDDDDKKNNDSDTNASTNGGKNIHKTKEKKMDCPFAGCGLHPNIIRAITSSRGAGLNLKRPTVIQRNAWKQILVTKDATKVKGRGKYKPKSKQRKNLFVQSETGSGKTLAYLLPIVQHLAIDGKTFEMKKVDRKLGGTRAIILCPTRELTSQTAAVAEKICLNSFPWLVAGCLSGGEKRKSEKARLRKGISILIATPGRLLDHLEKTESLLMALKGNLEWIVLDESDRLLDMGLGSQVEQIIQTVRANQPKSGINRDGITWQSSLVSATINDKVEKMASTLLGGDTWVWARASKSSRKTDNDSKGETSLVSSIDKESMQSSNLELSNATPHQLTQHHMVVSSKLRLTALIAFLTARVKKNERIVVFMSTCDGVDFHFKLLSQMQSIVPWEKGNEDLNEFKSKPGIFGSSCSLYRLHGNIPHKERNQIMSQFSNIDDLKSKGSILITTDVAARGLNLPLVDWIIQYDPPCETADYIHRAGRAARAGKAGHALLFLLPSEMQYIEVLNIRGLNKLTALSLSSTLQAAATLCPEVASEGLDRSSTAKSNSSRLGEAFTSAIQLRLEDCIMSDDKEYKEALAKKVLPNGGDKEERRKKRREAKNAVGPLLESARLAYAAYIRGYSTREKAVRHIFSARALHLGHVAKSFALREQPKELSKAQRSKRVSSKSDKEDLLKSTGRKRSSQLAFGKGNNDKKNKTGNFAGEIENKSRIQPNSETSDFNHRHRTIGSMKANMFALASKMEEADLEFF